MGIEVSFAGFIVGLIVGMTGMGGALIMTPIIIFLFGVSPALAIGTDLVYASVTKMFGAWQHWRQKTIDFTVVKWLCTGSLPGALAGVLMIMLMQNQFDTKMLNNTIGKILGITYLLIAGVMVYRMIRSKKQGQERSEVVRPPKYKFVILGAAGGFIVGMTSVGSGTLFMAVLTMMYPIASARLVGTDILQAVLVTGVAGIAHLSIGNVNMMMVGLLLIGSVPGILLGSRLTSRVPDMAIRSVLTVMLFLSGVKLLY